jgi:hypothetical protein
MSSLAHRHHAGPGPWYRQLQRLLLCYPDRKSLAKALGVSVASIETWEAGGQPQTTNKIRIAELYTYHLEIRNRAQMAIVAARQVCQEIERTRSHAEALDVARTLLDALDSIPHP